MQFSLYRDVNIRFFRRKEINFKPQRQLWEKSIAVSTIGDSIDSVNLQSTIDYRACNTRDKLIVSTIVTPLLSSVFTIKTPIQTLRSRP